ncbi:Crotonobetainyl-CoA:carnitine CoA-transferase CaiB [Thermomonospora echinospora]|uniref:Crotonobetainyl-CoA:carnitine CoA-transferase CaiB n=1 Tax=Thermomonospora echinospora TaxID=1992 RepID=A0A1H6DGH2_9ACTN|nr:CoA transferase [Thermomonospora echinospora]SEG83873.1 Crotonobetainyl-CoA:carnitine CoA-transferase CaiB [Thermomonospora echinospora]
MNASLPDPPCGGLSVVEVAAGTSELGLGLAGGVPGMLLGDLGADVVRVVGARPVPLDADVPWGRAWHRDKRIVATDDRDEICELLRGADVALVYGPEELVERRGLGHRELAETNPGLVYARCRPSRTAKGTIADYGLLVEAAAGFCTQLAGHRPGPIFVDVRAPGVGTASLLTVSVLGLLRRRALTGAGGWAETCLYDGMLATLGCMIGRSERAAPEIEGYWEKGSTFPNFLYRCADGELIQVWFGGKGMYASLIEVLGDEPSDEGYYTDQMTGRLGVRAKRWVSLFARRPRDAWIRELRAAEVACEPVLGPGEALADPHLTEIGLAVPRTDAGHRDVVLGSPISVTPLPGAPPPGRSSGKPAGRGPGLLSGVKVADFSAFVAGPLAAEVLADLGADVVKVEPPEGEAMRAAAYAVAACQRGKRSLALDIGAPEARRAVERLLGWADVVVHNFRVGVAERLGIGPAAVAELNPGAVYCHASAFGPAGRRARLPGNDALMQAVTGVERAIGGVGNDPIAATWIPVDMAGGWIAAAGILAGLYARAAGGQGRHVVTSLLGAGMLTHGGVFERDGELVRGPELDARQTGYGPGYRIYEGGDGAWFALVVPDREAWLRLAAEVPSLPRTYAPLRGGAAGPAAREAERVLEAAFAAAPAAAWVRRLHAAGLLAELIEPLDRDGFRRAILDDPVNRRTGRVVTYRTADWGRFEQIGPLLRCGPAAEGGPRLMIPRVGEHTVEVLAELGLDAEEIDALLAAKVARRLDEEEA